LTTESLNPKRDVPKSILITVSTITIIYLVVGMATVGIGIGPASRNHDADTALAISFELLGLKWMGQVVYIAAMFGVTACSLTMIISQTRVNYALSKDGLFYNLFQIMDEKT
jgi:APA family basic amino acid/polyamine antiporter